MACGIIRTGRHRRRVDRGLRWQGRFTLAEAFESSFFHWQRLLEIRDSQDVRRERSPGPHGLPSDGELADRGGGGIEARLAVN